MEGFSGSIESVFPQTGVQLCIVHLVRHSPNYVVLGCNVLQRIAVFWEVITTTKVDQASSAAEECHELFKGC
jgi:transposase-like protein